MALPCILMWAISPQKTRQQLHWSIVWDHSSKIRLEICRDRHDQRSCKNISTVYYTFKFFQKTKRFLCVEILNLPIYLVSLHFIHIFPPKLLKFSIVISINHSYWNLHCFIVGKVKPNLRIFSVKNFWHKNPVV